MRKIPYAAAVAATLFFAVGNVAYAQQGVAMSKPTPPSPEETQKMMTPYRQRIDALDAEIVALLGKRFDVIREVAIFKTKHGIHPIQPARIEEVVQRARAQAQKAGVDADLIEKLYRVIIQKACDEEEEYARAQEANGK
ncbi:MAG TPA: chorismate mutase [Alphaproteobacteria bacterium]|nr:chorismate mutase [Alphaproteobacteria bacterium]